MNYGTLYRSILSVVGDSGTAHNIMAVVASENWSHASDEILNETDLTDFEFRALVEWVRAYSPQYPSRVTLIQDMREVFPGLSLSAANRFSGLFKTQT